MEIQNILTLIQAFTDHSLTELCVEDSGVKVRLKKEPEKAAGPKWSETGRGLSEAGTVQPVSGISMTQVSETADMTGIPKSTPAQSDINSDKVVSSPLVGIFYSASSPEAEDFVKVGDYVKKGQVLGIIEAMKLMNEIESEYDGVIEAILVHNEDVVEYAQPLFRIR